MHTLDQHITSTYRGIVGRVPRDGDPAWESYLDAFAADPAMLGAARAEKLRLEALIAARSQGETHAVEDERRRLQALTLMLSRYEAAQGEGALNE